MDGRTLQVNFHLGIPVHGVRNYIRKIYEKLPVHSKVEAVNKYLRR